MNSHQLPFDGRPYAKLESLAIGDLGERLPEGPGDALLIYDGTVPYVYLANDDATEWVKCALIDVTGGEPSNGHVAKWDAAAHKVVFEAESGGGGGDLAIPWGKMSKSSAQVISTGGAEAIIWQNIDENDIGGFNLDGVYGNIFTAPETGVYHFHVSVRVHADAANRLVTIEMVDLPSSVWAQAQQVVGTSQITIELSFIHPCTAGKKFQALCNVNAGTVTVEHGITSRWEVMRLS